MVVRSLAHPIVQEKKFDLLSDLGGDIFATPPSQAASNSNFANFAHFPSQSGNEWEWPSLKLTSVSAKFPLSRAIMSMK